MKLLLMLILSIPLFAEIAKVTYSENVVSFNKDGDVWTFKYKDIVALNDYHGERYITFGGESFIGGGDDATYKISEDDYTKLFEIMNK